MGTMQRLSDTHYRSIRRVLLAILLLNWAVAFAKIVYGIIIKSGSMTADGFHSLSDGASNVVGLIGINFACRPRDQDHPYGHKKYETFFSLAIAMFLFLLALGLFHQAFERFRNPVTPRVDIQGFIIMLVTMAVNFSVMTYEMRRGKELNSDILVADAHHTKADILTSISVIVSLVAIRLGFPIVDPIVMVIIALFIVHAGYEIVREGSAVLCDTAVLTDMSKLSTIIKDIPGVKAFHNIRSRGRPDDVHVDLHVHVDPAMSMRQAHAISTQVEQAIKKGLPEITDVVVHMEPTGDKDYAA
jgi:cation diffusion facilitator family transporter